MHRMNTRTCTPPNTKLGQIKDKMFFFPPHPPTYTMRTGAGSWMTAIQISSSIWSILSWKTPWCRFYRARTHVDTHKHTSENCVLLQNRAFFSSTKGFTITHSWHKHHQSFSGSFALKTTRWAPSRVGNSEWVTGYGIFTVYLDLFGLGVNLLASFKNLSCEVHIENVTASSRSLQSYKSR